MFFDLPADVPITQNILHLALYLYLNTAEVFVKIKSKWFDEKEPIREPEHDYWDLQSSQCQTQVHVN